MSVAEGNSIKLSRVGMILAVVLHSQNPRVYQMFQKTMGINLWRQGASQQLFQTLSNMGLTMTAVTARATVDKLTAEHDGVVTKWKMQIQVGTKTSPLHFLFESGMRGVSSALIVPDRK